MGEELARILGELEDRGLLLEHDRTLPSVSALVAGKPIRGSWWGHKKGHDIFRVTRRLMEHPDALLVKLISGKLTFVHRRLWPALISVARSREPWQTADLSPDAAAILRAVERAGTLRADELERPKDEEASQRRRLVSDLERRLLFHATSVHTESGRHEKLLESWDACARRLKVASKKRSVSRAKRELEEALAAQNRAFSARGRLPWQARAH